MTYRFISCPTASSSPTTLPRVWPRCTVPYPYPVFSIFTSAHFRTPRPPGRHTSRSTPAARPPSWSAHLTADPSRSATLMIGTSHGRPLPLGHPRGRPASRSTPPFPRSRHTSRPTSPARLSSQSAHLPVGLSTRFTLLSLLTIPIVCLKLHSEMGDY